MLASLFLASFSLVFAQAPVTPNEIYRCTDAEGNVTYQQSKCPASGKSSRVDTQENGRSFDPPAREADWAKAAQEKRVQNGMPRRWVRAALGPPSQMHLGGDEGASETWEYDSAAGLLRVGFRDGNVLWTRDRRAVKLSPAASSDGTPTASGLPSSGDAVGSSQPTRPTVKLSPAPGTDGTSPNDGPRPSRELLLVPQANVPAIAFPASGLATGANTGAAPRDEVPVATPASPPPITAAALASATSGPNATTSTNPVRPAERRQSVALGNDCDVVRRDLGAADQDNGLGAPSPLALLRGGASDSRDLVYEPAPGDPGVRTRIRCVAGKVTAVERSHVP